MKHLSTTGARFGAAFLGALFCMVAAAQAQMPVFPGAEGYGGVFSGTAPTAGWFSNATVYHVTNLNDDGPGSFREAFDENSANKVIVFDVAGTIELTSGKLDIKNLANYYIAGQTAPGPVTIYGDMTQLTHSSGKENRNVVLRYLSFRKGTGDNSDSMTFAGSGLGTNLILDHVSASWAEDEILSVANNNTNVTVQYSMINDALVNNHAYGSLIRPRIDSQVTFHHNLYANNASRQARFGTYNGETLTADFRNNVVYNFRDRASYTGGSSESDQEQTDVNFVGNYIVAGPGTTGDPNIAYSVDKNVDTRVYQSGNFVDSNKNGLLDGSDTGWNMFRINNQTDQTLTQMATPFATPAVATQTATDAYHQVVDYVGNWWWDRDAIDARVIGNVQDFTGVPIGASAPISSELDAVVNAPTISHSPSYDADNDGMADAWEAAHGGDLIWNQDFDNDGYINLIDFVNELGEFPCPAPIVFEGGTNNRYAVVTNWRTDDGGITAGSHWQPAKYDDAIIRSGTVVVDAVGQHAGQLWIAPESGDNGALHVAAGWLRVEQAVAVGATDATGTLAIDAGAEIIATEVQVAELGTLSGSGVVTANVTSDGTTAPTSGADALTIDGDLTQTANGLLAIGLTSASEYARLNVTGDLAVEGALQVSLLGNFSPAAGDTFDLMDWSGGSSFALSMVELPELDSGLAWDQTQLTTAGILSVGAASPILLGDFNEDGIVNLGDYAAWRDRLGADVSLPNDNNLGIPIGAAHYQLWKDNFGAILSSAGSLAESTVPEPSPLSLLGLGGACCLAASLRPRARKCIGQIGAP